MNTAKHFSFLSFLFFFLLGMIFTTSLEAQACNLLSGNFNLGGDSHDLGFQNNNSLNTVATLSNGNFVVAWETRDDVDGDGNGAFYQLFNESGQSLTEVMTPYGDVNAMGMGKQGVGGPKVIALTTGFVIGWESEDGPGDTGPVDDDQQDVFFRVYNNDGSATSPSTRISMPLQEDQLEYILPLSTGNFVVLTSIDEDVIGNNKDDYFFEVFNTLGVSINGGMVDITSGAHDAAFQSIDRSQPMADLGGGTFVIAWESRDDIDGNGNGGFCRIFNEAGTPITGILMPYEDINAEGTGDQGTPGPKVLSLENGNFVVFWESREGPGDLGPGGSDSQDIYFRIYQANGTPLTGTMKANSDNTADKEQLSGLILLTGGNFAIVYHRDEDDTGNNDDYFVRVFTPLGMAAGGSIEVSNGAHTEVFCNIQGDNHGFIALNNGNFVIGWAARDDADGDDAGAYYRVFDSQGSAVSPVVLPYQDINPEGTGKQSTSGPRLKALPNGFTVAWHSKQGPGDVGPLDDEQDVYHRVINNEGNALCGSIKTNTDNDAEEEILMAVQALANGNFVVVYKEDEDDTGNKDDYFIRVIGGAPLQNICPTLGNATVSESAVCEGNSFNFVVTNLQNMAMSTNNEQDYGLKIVAFNDATNDPHNGGTMLGTIAFEDLTNGQTTATLTGIIINTADVDLFIYAILDMSPSDGACLPSAQTIIEIKAFPTVAFSNPAGSFCLNAGVQTGLGSGTPTGGIYSGLGVNDDGNGLTYSFDPTVVGIGNHSIIYDFNANGCSSSATNEITILAVPSVSLTSSATFTLGAGIQNGLGGGTPVGGVYSGTGVTDDGNGMNYSFNPMLAGVGEHMVTYTFTDGSGCIEMASDMITVSEDIFGNDCPEANDINALFGQELAEPQISSLWDNTAYASSSSDPTTGIDCFFNGDGLQHTIWYTFIGDGNTYNIKTIACNATNYITGGDTQMAIYGGDCNNLNPIACNEDEDANANLLNINLDLLTEVGLIYYVMIDGYTTSVGEFCIQVTLSEVTAVTHIEDSNIVLFPNPTTGQLTLKNVEVTQLEVFDNTGRMIMNIDRPGVTLDLSTFSSGMYFLKIHTEEKIFSARVVKQ